MAEEKNIGHIDIANLLQQAKSVLSFEGEVSHPLSDDELQLLLDGRTLKVNEEILEYVSFYALYDVEYDTYYPFFYVPVKKDNDSFSIAKMIPYLNTMAEEFLDYIGLNTPTFTAYGTRKGLSELGSEIEKKKIANRIQIVKALNFLSAESLQLCRLYPDLVKMNANNEDKGQFESIFFHENTKDKADRLKDIDGESLFSRQIRAMNRLDTFHGAKVSYQDDYIRNHFIDNFLHHYLSQNKSVLFVMNEVRYEEAKQAYSDIKLNDFIFEYRRLKPSDYQAEQVQYHYEEPMKNGEIIFSKFREAEDHFDELAFERMKNFVYPEKLIHDVLSIDDENLMNIYDLKLDTRDYHESDYEQDETFLNMLQKKPSVRDSFILNHRYYGLSVGSKRSNYDSIQLLVIALNGEIRNFFNAITNQPSLVEYGWTVSTLGEYKELQKNIRILRGYNGFPKKYFKTNYTKDIIYKLDNLKQLYQAVSSSRLLVSNLCYENIYIADLGKMIALYKGNFLQKWKAKGIIKKYLRTTKKIDYKVVFRILEAYLDAQERLKAALPKCIEEFGNSVMTMNGVVEIEANIRYIKSFNERTEEMEDFTMDEPFIKKWMNNKNFRLDMDDFFKERDTEFEKIQSDLKEFIAFFSEGPRNYEDVEYTGLLRHFSRISLSTFDEFEDYALMKEAFENSTLTLQLAVRKYENMQRPLSDFAKAFRMSLMRGYFSRGKHTYLDCEDEFQECFSEFYSYLIDGKEIAKCKSYNNIAHYIVSYCNRDEFREEYCKIRDTLLSGQLNQKDRRELYRNHAKFYPITVVKSKDLGLIDDGVYDEVVVFDSKGLSDLELLNAYRAGNNVLILDALDKTDTRTQNYHNTLLSRQAIFDRFFEKKKMTKRLIKIIEDEAKDMDFEFRTDMPNFPYIIASTKYPGRYYGVLPDIMIPKTTSINEMRELRMFLIQENILLVPFTTLYFFTDQKKETKELYHLILEAIERKKERQKIDA